MKKTFNGTLATWLPIAAAIACIYGIMFLSIQQYVRLSANELPMQFAEDVRIKLQHGIPPGQVVAGLPQVDMERSLSTFVAVCDSHGTVVAGTGTLNSKYPAPPMGALDASLRRGESRITWMPQRGLRFATVILPLNSGTGFVLAGRSLREVEMRKAFAFSQIFWGAVITFLLTFVMVFFIQYYRNRNSYNTA